MTNMNSIPLKRIRLVHAHNVRDLGGYVTLEHKIVRWNRLFRSDSLHLLEKEEWEILSQRGIRTIIDLRSETEIKNSPDKIPEGMEWIECPLQEEQINMQNLSEDALKAFTKSLETGYAHMIDNHPELFAKAIKTVIAQLPKGAVLFHCSAGKDRTGILAAALLWLVQVEKEDITADYEVSYTYNSQGINRMAQQMIPEFEKIEPLLRSDAINMERLVNYFEELPLKKLLLENGIEETDFQSLEKEILG